VLAATLSTPRAAHAGCNPGTQDIADCITVPRGPAYNPPRTGGGGGLVNRGGGGGGNNVAAGLGAAAAGLGSLGEMLDEAERAKEAAQAAANQAYCNANFRQAADDINTGNNLIDRWQAGDAIP
jgi:hypothetical protein